MILLFSLYLLNPLTLTHLLIHSKLITWKHIMMHSHINSRLHTGIKHGIIIHHKPISIPQVIGWYHAHSHIGIHSIVHSEDHSMSIRISPATTGIHHDHIHRGWVDEVGETWTDIELSWWVHKGTVVWVKSLSHAGIVHRIHLRSYIWIISLSI